MTRTTIALAAAAALLAPLAASADGYGYGYDYGYDYGYTSYDYPTTYGYGHGYHYDPAPYINHIIHQQIPTPWYGNGNVAPVYTPYQYQPVSTYGHTGYTGYGYSYGY